MRKKLTLLVDETLAARAKQQGMNLSQFLETQLRNIVPLLEEYNVDGGNNGKNSHRSGKRRG